MPYAFPLLGILSALCPRVESSVCTCVPGPTLPNEAALRAAIVDGAAFFTGKVVRTGNRSRSADSSNSGGQVLELVVTIAVTGTWSGTVPDTVAVVTPVDTAACGASFSPGASYFIDARSIGPGLFSTTKCSRTQPLEEASPILAQLRRLRP